MLPQLDGHTLLEWATAKQDKLDIAIGEWHVQGVDPQAYELLLSLADHLVPLPDNPNGLRWFNQPQGIRQYNPRIHFASGGRGGHITHGKPLISGKIQANRRDGGYAITAVLSLNPTRFVRHRGSTLPTHREPELWIDDYDPVMLLSRQLPSVNSDERILDGNDNVLLSKRSQFAGRPDVWNHQVELYWRYVQHFLLNQLQDTARTNHIPLAQRATEINLRTAQTYWEFYSDDALDTVSRLVPAMQALGNETNIRSYPIAEEEQIFNSLSVKVRLTRAMTCTLYAKTSKRVRMEIAHDLMSDASVLGGGHVSSDPDVLLEWLQRLAQDAADKGNQVLSHMSQQIIRATSQRPVYDFLNRISRAVDDEATNDLIVSTLVNTSRISLRNRDPLRPIVVRLVNDEVLVRTRRYQPQFGVHPKYGAAIAELRGFRRRRG